MSLQTVGIWAAGVWAEDTWADCVWFEDHCEVAAPAPAPALAVVETGGGVSSDWKRYADKRRKRKQLQEDDEEIMRMIQMAMPEIIKEYFDG